MQASSAPRGPARKFRRQGCHPCQHMRVFMTSCRGANGLTYPASAGHVPDAAAGAPHAAAAGAAGSAGRHDLSAAAGPVLCTVRSHGALDSFGTSDRTSASLPVMRLPQVLLAAGPGHGGGGGGSQAGAAIGPGA